MKKTHFLFTVVTLLFAHSHIFTMEDAPHGWKLPVGSKQQKGAWFRKEYPSMYEALGLYKYKANAKEMVFLRAVESGDTERVEELSNTINLSGKIYLIANMVASDYQDGAMVNLLKKLRK